MRIVHSVGVSLRDEDDFDRVIGMRFAPFREAGSERESDGLDTTHRGEPIVRIKSQLDFQSDFPAKNSA